MLGLYITAKEAYEMWKANPEKVIVLDVRTNEEFVYIGHPEMAWNIPAFLQDYHWNAEKKLLPIYPNPEFMQRVKELFKPEDTLVVTCRSGGRAAFAINQLAAAGYKNVYNLVDGIEGDKVDDAESIFNGKPMKNGWKNAGLPWTYQIIPEKMFVPKTR